MREDALTLCQALGYDLNTVEFAVEDGVPYAIDFMNPAPDAGLESVGQENFKWVVEAVADMAIERALEQPLDAAVALGEVSGGRRVGQVERSRRSHESQPLAEAAPVSPSGSKRSTRPSIPRPGTCGRTSPPRSCKRARRILAERVKPEMHQSVVEIGTGVCHNIKEARDEIRAIRAADHHPGARRTACGSPPAARIPSPTGATRRSIPTSGTRPSSRT